MTTLIFLPVNHLNPTFRSLFAALILMLFVGMKDDILLISPRKKLLAQLIAAAILVFAGGFRISNFHGLAFQSDLPYSFSAGLSVVLILFLINAINLIDGIDGLAAGICLLAAIVLGTWFMLSGYIACGMACTALSGSLLAFLRFNLWGKKNKLFMGDTGSLILGTFLAAMIIKFNELNTDLISPFHLKQAPVIALSLMIVPVSDTLRVFAIRLWHKKSPFAPDKNHVHHLLIKSGLTHIQSSCFLLYYTALFTATAFLLQAYLDITLHFLLLLSLSFSFIGLIYLLNKQQLTGSKVTASIHAFRPAPFRRRG